MTRTNNRDEAFIVANQNIKEREYWTKCCSGDFVKSSFPYSFKKDPGDNREKAEFTSTWTGETGATGDVFQGLMKLSGGVDVKLHMILVAGLKALLYIYTGNTDISIGSPVLKQEAGGELINRILVYRTPVRDAMSFKELLLKVRETIIQAAEHQNFPLDLLPEILDMPINDREFPLFEVALVLENIHDREYLQGIENHLLFSFLRTGEGLEITVRYAPWLYDRESIRGIVEHLKNLLSGAMAGIDQPLTNLDILAETERQRLLTDFNSNRLEHLEYTDEDVFSRLFEEQAEKYPDREAVIVEDPDTGAVCRQDYGELNERANRLARVLREKGAGPDTIIAIMLERSADMIAAVLAVIKAGAAYLPIDPAYPADRVDFMLADSRAPILITKTSLSDGVKFNGERITLENNTFSHVESGNLPPVNFSFHLVYVIYTSGSTGKPKGVMVQHHNLINAALGWRREYGLENMEVNLLQMASFSFDVSCGDLARALLNGGKMVITPDAGMEPEFLYRLISTYRITLFESTPSYIVPFMQYVYDNGFEIPDLKLLIVGSDNCRVEDFNGLLAKYGNRMRIINSYGVTEATIDSSYYEGSPGAEGLSGDVPIGKPLPNVAFYIFNRQGQVLPVGVPGNLFIGGLGVARGYMNRPELTSERFLATDGHRRTQETINQKLLPGVQRGGFLEKSPSGRRRLYRTGDLARWLPDGNVMFLGRADFQVKIRGFRIELGEIEARVSGHPAVKEAIVSERQDGTGEKYLCAYFVPKSNAGNEDLSPSAWREYLGAVLPDYMIPAYFVPLEKMPLSSNGKLDRKALPEPGFGGSKTYRPPRNHLEQQMVNLWSDVLYGGVPLETPIGIDDNFFELGGQSLKATVLVYRIHKEFHIKLPLVQVFQTPTVRELAAYIGGKSKDGFITVNPVEKQEYYLLSPAQKRLFILQQSQPESVFYNIPMAVKIIGEYSEARITEAFARLIRRHESLRTSFTLVGNTPVQRIHDGAAADTSESVPVSTRDGLASNDEVKQAIKDFIRSFDLSRAPLLRVGLFTVGEGETASVILCVDLHHIISDGVSNWVLIRDFNAFYDGDALPPLRLQYKDATRWQLDRLRSGEAKAGEEFWLKEFSGPLPRLELPFDIPRSAAQGYVGSMFRFDIAEETAVRLRELAAAERVTMYTLLLALYNVLLFKLSGQPDIVVGTSALGRRHADLETVIGMFVNTLALRNHPTEEATFVDFLQTVNRRTLEALDHQDYQFDDLVEKVMVTREPGRNPLFDVMFSYSQRDERDKPSPEPGTGGLNTAPFDMGGDEGLVKFDLVMEASDGPGKLFFIFAYSKSLFKPETMERYGEYVKELVSDVLANKAIKLGDIAISHDLEHSSREIYQGAAGDFEF